MVLETLWFVLIGILFTGYFILEGFDFGVGLLLPFIGRNDKQRRVLINSIGPHWDGNEVWLITAGGAMFAAFPHWYATLFSGLYIPLFFILMALIIRGVAFEFRNKESHTLWRSFWDWAIFFGSLLPAFLWGIVFANLARGLPIDAEMNFIGRLIDLLNPFGILGGIVSLTGFLLIGAIFLTLKTRGVLFDRVKRMAKILWIPSAIAVLCLSVFSYWQTDLSDKGAISIIAPVVSILGILLTGWFFRASKFPLAFIFSAITTGLLVTGVFLTLFPRVMISSLNPAWSMTIIDSASQPYTLKTMTIIAAILLPLVLIYQAWSYRLFRKRINEEADDLIY